METKKEEEAPEPAYYSAKIRDSLSQPWLLSNPCCKNFL